MKRAALHAPRDRLTTGVRERAGAADVAANLASTGAHVVALEAVSEAVLIVDRSGVVVFANPAATALTGHRPKHLIGRHVWSVLTPQVAPALWPMMRSLGMQRAYRGRVDAVHASGNALPLEVSVTAVPDADGHLQHFCLVARPVAEPLADTSAGPVEALGRVAAELAHDFNNQIAVVLNYTFILQRQLPPASPLREHVEQLQASAWRASRVAQDMIAFGGPRMPEPDAVDLNVVVANLGPLLAHALQDAATFEFRPAAGLRLTRARLPQLEWLIIELALHARVWLGGVSQVSFVSWNAEGKPSQTDPGGGTDAALTDYVGFTLRALPHVQSDAVVPLLPLRASLSSEHFPAEASAMPGAEITVSRARGKLTTTREPDGSIRYDLWLPAV